MTLKERIDDLVHLSLTCPRYDIVVGLRAMKCKLAGGITVFAPSESSLLTFTLSGYWITIPTMQKEVLLPTDELSQQVHSDEEWKECLDRYRISDDCGSTAPEER